MAKTCHHAGDHRITGTDGRLDINLRRTRDQRFIGAYKHRTITAHRYDNQLCLLVEQATRARQYLRRIGQRLTHQFAQLVNIRLDHIRPCTQSQAQSLTAAVQNHFAIFDFQACRHLRVQVRGQTVLQTTAQDEPLALLGHLVQRFEQRLHILIIRFHTGGIDVAGLLFGHIDDFHIHTGFACGTNETIFNGLAAKSLLKQRCILLTQKTGRRHRQTVIGQAQSDVHALAARVKTHVVAAIHFPQGKVIQCHGLIDRRIGGQRTDASFALALCHGFGLV